MSDNNEHINNLDQNFKNRFEQEGINPPENAWDNLEDQFEEIENDAFDEAIRDKFSESINPPAELWQNIDKATQKESRNYRGAYWIILGSIIGCLGAYFLVETFDSKIEIVESSNQQKTVEEILKSSDDTNQKELTRIEEIKQTDKYNKAISQSSNESNNTNLTDLSINENLIENSDSNLISDEVENFKRINSPVIPDTLDTSVTNQLQAPKNHSVEPTEKSDFNKPITKKDSNTEQESDNNPPLFTTAPDTENEKNTTDSISTNSKSKTDKKELTTDFSNKESTPKKTENIKSRDNTIDSNIIADIPSQPKVDSLASSIDSAKSMSLTTPDSTIIASADTLPDSNSVATTDTSNVKPADEGNKKKLNKDSTKKWMVTTYIVPEFQYQRVRKNGSNNHFFDSLLTSNFSQLFEIGVSYNIKKQFQIGIGFSMNKYSHHYSKNTKGINSTIPIKATYPSGIVEVNGLFGNTQTPDLIEIQMAPNGADLNEILFNEEILYDEKLDYTLVNIPFDVKWVPSNYRVKPVIKLGGEFNLITKSSSEVSLTFFEETTTVVNHAQLRGINFSGSFGLGTQIDLIKGLGITLLPSLNYQSSGVSNNSEFQFTPYSVRLYSGVYYKF